MREIIIVGAGPLGREIYNWIVSCDHTSRIKGFIDNFPDALNNYDYPVKIIGDIDNHSICHNCDYILAVMLPRLKKDFVIKLKNKGCQFTQFIHPTAMIGKNVSLDEGVVITPYCILSCDIKLGNFVFLNTQTSVGHDVKIGEYSSLNSKVTISGSVEIGDEVMIGSSALILPNKKIASSVIIGSGSVVVGNIKNPVTVFGNPAKAI